MILAILVAYKAFNNKSLTIATDEHVYSNSIVNDINDMFVTITSVCDYDDNDSNIYTIYINDIIGIQVSKVI